MIVAGIASIPARKESLRRVLDSIVGQVDEVYLALNYGGEDPPEYLDDYLNVYWFTSDNNMGDAMKFSMAHSVKGYYFSCDDDLVYHTTYVRDMIAMCETYNCPVSLAGKIFKYPVANYHRDFKAYYHCLRDVDGDHEVTVVGTGVLCFRTDQIKVTMSDFETKNMADVWFAKLAKEQGVKLMVIGHRADYLHHINHDWTIWRNAPKTGKETDVLNKFLSE